MITHFDADIYWLNRSHSRFLKPASSQTVSRSIVNRFYKQSKNPYLGDDPFLRGLALGLIRTPGERMHRRRITDARRTDRPLRQQLRATSDDDAQPTCVTTDIGRVSQGWMSHQSFCVRPTWALNQGVKVPCGKLEELG